MFRISLIISVLLIFSITAKPWNKLPDEAFQETVMTIDDEGKPSFKVEVEPPENMDGIHYNIDPQMRIWKSMTGGGQSKQFLKAEEDLDEVYHPSLPELLQVQKQNLGPAADTQAELPQEDVKVQYRQEVEEDRDFINHPDFEEVAAQEPEENLDDAYNKAREELAEYLAPLVAKHKAGAHVAPYQPEKDEDQFLPLDGLRREMSERKFRVHLQPEEDMDGIYHKDFLVPVFNQDNTEAAAPVDLPFQGKYSVPEEDMDHIYHQ